MPPLQQLQRLAQWTAFLDKTRAAEDWRGLAQVQHSGPLQRLVTVWPSVVPPWVPPAAAVPAHAGVAWRQCWPPFFLEAIAIRMCDALQWEWEYARTLLQSAVDLRVVYPDGNVHASAESYVQAASLLQDLEARAGKLPPGGSGAPSGTPPVPKTSLH